MPLSKWLVVGAALLPLAAGAQIPGPQDPADPRAAVPAVPDASLFPRYRAAADAPGTPAARWRQADREVAARDDAMSGMQHDMRHKMQPDEAMPDMPDMPDMQHDAEQMTHAAHGATPAMHGMHHSPPAEAAAAGHVHPGGH